MAQEVGIGAEFKELAKAYVMVVHRDSPIRKTRMHFYSVSSVKRLTEKLVNKIKELEEFEKRLSYDNRNDI